MAQKYGSKVVEFLGAPGSGKTTLAHTVFSWLKTTGSNSVFVSEVATDWINQGKLPEDQFLVSAEQNHRLYNMLGQYEYIVMDTSLLLGCYYIDMPHSLKKYREISDDSLQNAIWSYKATLQYLHTIYDNITIFKELQDYPHSMVGRIHDKKQSQQIEYDLKNLLTSLTVPYTIANDIETCKKIICPVQTTILEKI